MSSTKRGGVRAESDVYLTPLWCTSRILERLVLPGGVWVEPCAGTGNIIVAANRMRNDVSWRAYELRPECVETLHGIGTFPVICNFLSENVKIDYHVDVILMNPPYREAQAFIDKCLTFSDNVVALLRLNYLGSKERNPFMLRNCPDVYVLPNRPVFDGSGKTDSIEYAWMHWRKGDARSEGRLVVLSNTPKEERR